MTTHTKIRTLRDALAEKHAAEALAEHRNAVKAARAKVRHWERQAAKFDGEAHHRTLAKFRAELAALLAR